MSGRGRAWRPIASLVLYLLVAAAAAGAAAPAAASRSQLRAVAPPITALGIGTLAVVGMAGLYVMVAVSRAVLGRRGHGQQQPIVIERHVSKRAQAAAAGVALAAAGAAVALLVTLASNLGPARLTAPTAVGDAAPATRMPRPSARATLPPHHGVPAALWIAVGIATLAVLAAGYLIVRRRRGQPTLALPERAGQTSTGVQKLLEHATEALEAGQNPRAAIIACYRSMERSLASVGVGPLPADTPEEVLYRAAHAGIAQPSAIRLAELFREARFSVHPMSPEQQQEAVRALAGLRTSLGDDP